MNLRKKTASEGKFDALKVFAPFVGVALAGIVAVWVLMRPAPPSTLRMATGSPGGAYAAHGESYRAALAREGITLELVPTTGLVTNLSLLTAPTNGVDIAFVQGGIGSPQAYPGVETLGGMFPEPVWMFVRGEDAPRRVTELRGRRVAIGLPGSGTRALAEWLFSVNGLGEETPRLSIGGTNAVRALIAGEVDAAMFVTAGNTDSIRRLLSLSNIQLMEFQRAETYQRLDPVLSAMTLPEGALDLAANLPDRPVRMLAPVAHLLAREDLHPAIASLLAQVATRIHEGGGIYASPGVFPSRVHFSFPLNEDARHFYQNGPSFLRRYLPFWAANLIQRMIVLAVPLATLLIPVVRMAPPTYRWRIRRRIYKWYGDIRDIEQDAQIHADPASQARQLADLDRIQADVAGLKVPLSYAEHHYNLRMHIELVRAIIRERAPNAQPSSSAD